MTFNSFYLLMVVCLCSFSGCENLFKKTTPTIKENLLNLHAMPEQQPKNLQQQLAWGLWNLNQPVIDHALAAGSDPYTLHNVVNVTTIIPSDKQLSPYALILEGYLDRTNTDASTENIQDELKKLYKSMKLLIKNNISVDKGVITFGSNPSMRTFVQDSIVRLNKELTSQSSFDEEGKYALNTWQQIQAAINKYQPE